MGGGRNTMNLSDRIIKEFKEFSRDIVANRDLLIRDVDRIISKHLSELQAKKFKEICKGVRQALENEHYAWSFVSDNENDIKYLLYMGVFRTNTHIVEGEMELFVETFKELYLKYRLIWLYEAI